jgi:enoyl-CoA hydratase
MQRAAAGGDFQSMENLRVEVAEEVATITLNRPEQRNAINHAMWTAIPSLCRQLEADPAVRVVIWQGAGDEAFSAGGDIHEFVALRGDREQARHYNGAVQVALQSVRSLGKPTLARIRGYCVGGGLMLATHCDLRLAGENSRFSVPVARLGAVITYDQMQRFMQIIGPARTLELLLTTRWVEAEEARVWGLVNRVLPVDQLEEETVALARQLAALSPQAHRVHKQMLQTLLEEPKLARLSPAEYALVDDVFAGADYAEGVQAFIEKRSPHF